MAKARAITKRRKAVRNIKKITQTMQLIATARFQKTLQRAMATKPYTEQITQMVQTVAATDAVQRMLQELEQSSGARATNTGASAAKPSDGSAQPAAPSDEGRKVIRLLRPNDGVEKAAVIVITSNRGLCGGYNANVLRSAMDHIRNLASQGLKPSVEMVGKKGVNYFRFLNQPIDDKIIDIEDKIDYARVAVMADRLIAQYLNREINRVDVVYMRFMSVGVQRPNIAKLLPIDPPEAKAGEKQAARVDFEFSPPPEVLLARLIPETIKIRLFQYFNDAIVSEQVARMVAMKAATDAAGDMIKFLTREYNRARQSQITMELLDIMGGAEAIK